MTVVHDFGSGHGGETCKLQCGSVASSILATLSFEVIAKILSLESLQWGNGTVSCTRPLNSGWLILVEVEISFSRTTSSSISLWPPRSRRNRRGRRFFDARWGSFHLLVSTVRTLQNALCTFLTKWDWEQWFSQLNGNHILFAGFMAVLIANSGPFLQSIIFWVFFFSSFEFKKRSLSSVA